MEKEQGGLFGMAHIGLFVSDMDQTVGFYHGILGFAILYETTVRGDDGPVRICFIRLGDLCIEAVQFPKSQQRPDGPFDHIAVRVKDIERVKERLERAGIVFEEDRITPRARGMGKRLEVDHVSRAGP